MMNSWLSLTGYPILGGQFLYMPENGGNGGDTDGGSSGGGNGGGGDRGGGHGGGVGSGRDGAPGGPGGGGNDNRGDGGSRGGDGGGGDNDGGFSESGRDPRDNPRNSTSRSQSGGSIHDEPERSEQRSAPQGPGFDEAGNPIDRQYGIGDYIADTARNTINQIADGLGIGPSNDWSGNQQAYGDALGRSSGTRDAVDVAGRQQAREDMGGDGGANRNDTPVQQNAEPTTPPVSPDQARQNEREQIAQDALDFINMGRTDADYEYGYATWQEVQEIQKLIDEGKYDEAVARINQIAARRGQPVPIELPPAIQAGTAGGGGSPADMEALKNGILSMPGALFGRGGGSGRGPISSTSSTASRLMGLGPSLTSAVLQVSGGSGTDTGDWDWSSTGDTPQPVQRPNDPFKPKPSQSTGARGGTGNQVRTSAAYQGGAGRQTTTNSGVMGTKTGGTVGGGAGPNVVDQGVGGKSGISLAPPGSGTDEKLKIGGI